MDNQNYGLVVVNQKRSKIFSVNKQGEGNGYVVPAPGVKLRDWLPLVKEADARIFKHVSLDFYIVWSSDYEQLEELVQLLDQYPDVPLSHIFR